MSVLYCYDDKGNRVQKRSASLNEYYLLDHTGRELACYNAATGELKSLNLYGGGALGRVQVTWSGSTRTDTKYYYVKDHLGSIKMTLGTGGSIAAARDYYPFGETLREYQSGVTDRFKFTEKERDNETNYDYFGARYYDSELGRWMTVDPMAAKYPGWSPYNYCINSPLILIDPKGKEPNDKKEKSASTDNYIFSYWQKLIDLLSVDNKGQENNEEVTSVGDQTKIKAITKTVDRLTKGKQQTKKTVVKGLGKAHEIASLTSTFSAGIAISTLYYPPVSIEAATISKYSGITALYISATKWAITGEKEDRNTFLLDLTGTIAGGMSKFIKPGENVTPEQAEMLQRIYENSISIPFGL